MQTGLITFLVVALVLDIVITLIVRTKEKRAHKRKILLINTEIDRLNKLLKSVLNRSVEYDKRIITLENKTRSKADE